ncbi:MAG: 3D domain-containing protein [Verrucomicrobiales bacterium]
MALVAAFVFTSCNTTSNLTALSRSNVDAVAQIALEEPSVDADADAAVDSAAEAEAPSEAIVGAPPSPEPVAVERPVSNDPPILLASVPCTPVERRPTNQIMMVRTTAYSHLEADSLQYGTKSAAGTDLKYGSQVRSAAADWSKYPLGTRFKIEGISCEYVVDDYGRALCGTETIDIYKPNLAGIGAWGVRNVPIRVLEWGCFEKSREILDSRKHVRHAHHVREMLQEIERKGRSGDLGKPSTHSGTSA